MAWATVHVGIIGFDFDMFRAELCFKGGIEYGLNILKVITIKTMCDDDRTANIIIIIMLATSLRLRAL